MSNSPQTTSPQDDATGVASRTCTFAVVLTWPEMKNAEYEVAQRIVQAGHNVGFDSLIVDHDGYVLWSSLGGFDANRRITGKDCDFVISLHFESPKLIDVYTYTTLWNPPEFFFEFGYAKSIAKLSTNDDFLSCRSTLADVHALNMAGPRAQKLLPIPELFHSIPEPYRSPNISESSTLFYVGMNWERLGGGAGRHQTLLRSLDDMEMISIFGPEVFNKVRPWEGYKRYSGEIPFDGISVLDRINGCGICLAFSSEAHRRSGIMSNRLFEGIAGGAVVICDAHPFAVEYFSDCVYIVDHTQEAQALTSEIIRIVHAVRADPEKAKAMALVAQGRMRQNFSLEKGLSDLGRLHAGRVARQVPTTNAPTITVILASVSYDKSALLSCLTAVAAQVGVAVELILVCDSGFFKKHEADIVAATAAFKNWQVITGTLYAPGFKPLQSFSRQDPIGPHILDAFRKVKTEFFCLLRDDELWFSNHLASLFATLDGSPAMFAASGQIIESVGSSNKPMRHLDTTIYSDMASILACNNVSQSGRFLYRRDIIDHLPQIVFDILDTQEHNLLNFVSYMQGELVNSGRATYVGMETVRAGLPKPVFPPEFQHQFIRDAVALDPRKMIREAQTARMTEYVYAAAPSTRIYWQNYQSPYSATFEIEIGAFYDLTAGAKGLKLLERGFSFPEPDRVWMEGAEASLSFVVPAVDGPLELAMVIGAKSSDTAQNVTIVFNGFVLGYFAVWNTPTPLRCKIPFNLLQGMAGCRLSIIADHASLVRDDAGTVVDDRMLSVFVSKIGLFPDSQAARLGGDTAAAGGKKSIGRLLDRLPWSQKQ